MFMGRFLSLSIGFSPLMMSRSVTSYFKNCVSGNRKRRFCGDSALDPISYEMVIPILIGSTNGQM